MADAIEELARVIAEIDTGLHELRKAIDSPDDESGREYAIIERLSFRMLELTRLGEDIEHITKEAVAQAANIERLTAQRDSARRILCVTVCGLPDISDTKEEMARRYGWDCFNDQADSK
jgi:hypothetical protein